MLDGKTLGFLGGGNMAAALVKGILHAKLVSPDRVIVSDVKKERLESLHETHGIQTTLHNDELVAKADVVVLSVKPQVIDKVLTGIAVDPKRRGKGIGAALLEAGFADLLMSPARRMFLEVADDNRPAIALYRRFGFSEIGRRKGYYPRPDGTPATALVMARNLG